MATAAWLEMNQVGVLMDWGYRGVDRESWGSVRERKSNGEKGDGDLRRNEVRERFVLVG